MTTARFAAFAISIITMLTFSFQPLVAYSADGDDDQPFILDEASIVISEISPITQADGTKEFLELHNRTTEALPIDNICIVRDSAFDGLCVANAKNMLRLSGPALLPGEHRVVDASSAPDKLSSATVILPDAGATLELYYLAEAPLKVQRQTYTKPSNGQSLQLVASELALTSPLSPGTGAPQPAPPSIPDTTVPETPPQEPPVSVPEPVPAPPQQPATPACTAQNVFISEIVANPAGADSEGGEFIELYNDGDAPALLEHCGLSTDKFAQYPFAASNIIPAKGYLALDTQDGLLNGGGRVMFAGKDYDDIVNYPALKDDESYSLIGSTWQISSKLTPNMKNELPPTIPDTDDFTESLKPCPAGKFRNPATNRCKTLAAEGSSALAVCAPGKVRNPETNRCRNIASANGLTPCKPGQYRSPETNRCRSLVASITSLMPCKSGQERNPETNRCRKVVSASRMLTPCKEGYARNPETNRCRKETSVATTTAFTDANETNQGNIGHNATIIGIATTMLVLFLAYEYRMNIRDFVTRLLPNRK